MKNIYRKRGWIGLTMLLLACAVAPHAWADAEESWEFSLTPYGWLPSIDGDMNYGQQGLSVNPESIVKGLSWATLISGEARKGKWSVLGDVVYLRMGDSKNNSVSLPNGSGVSIPVNADLNMKSWVVHLIGGCRVLEDERVSMDVLAGLRYFYLSSTLDLSSPALPAGRSLSAAADLWNGVVGIRGEITVVDALFIPYYLDLGTGSADFTWQGMSGLGYKFSWGDLLATYRYLSFDQGGGDAIEKMSFGGLAVGAKFRF